MLKLINRLFGRLPKPLALPSREFGAQPDDYTWENWKEENKNKHPFRYWLHETLPRWFKVKFLMRVENWWYWLQQHTYRRRYLLDLRSDVGLKYEWGWVDKDGLMLLACFNLLRAFVEKEYGLSYLNHNDKEWYNKAEQWEKDTHNIQCAYLLELKSLYDWWMIGRQKDHDSLDNLKGSEYYEEQERLYDKDDEMLIKLIRHRKYLWT